MRGPQGKETADILSSAHGHPPSLEVTCMDMCVIDEAGRLDVWPGVCEGPSLSWAGLFRTTFLVTSIEPVTSVKLFQTNFHAMSLKQLL